MVNDAKEAEEISLKVKQNPDKLNLSEFCFLVLKLFFYTFALSISFKTPQN